MNYRIFFISIVFWIIETNYFGWNTGPNSPEEVICDGIFTILVALAVLK